MMFDLHEPAKPARLRLALRGLILELGYPGGHCYRVTLEPEDATRLAGDLLRAVRETRLAGHVALEELDALTGCSKDGEC